MHDDVHPTTRLVEMYRQRENWAGHVCCHGNNLDRGKGMTCSTPAMAASSRPFLFRGSLHLNVGAAGLQVRAAGEREQRFRGAEPINAP